MIRNATEKESTNALTLQVGDTATTDFEETRIATVTIKARKEGAKSQTGVLYQVSPTLRNCTSESWIDAGWFKADTKA